ncbi:MAG: hypothetical protein UHD04_03090 [Muribaculaceae bacterium]|nr:hypothetical protein [Muribaculaceae bacterium]
MAKTCLILRISSQNNNVLKHLTSRANEGRVSSSLDLCRVQPRMAECNFTRNQVGMQVNRQVAVKHQGLRYA